ncbi:unnamed protein product [Cyclocybe aegerita]|uniref:AA9 family lytic polysaccharide monooxygenase n=1 Tax=Cyclocybe aegerita TaxID=1973307 RepID=A0A8S0WED4_CYCAE|nr:unnamed protein product [Cyclocybe aegerita]
MKFSTTVLGLAAIAQSASAHYIFTTLIAGSSTSTTAVRTPKENSPIPDYKGTDVRCNVNTSPATETVSVAAGSKIGFGKIFHLGPAAMYLGQAPGSAADWDGSGQNWFKIADWGATFDPFSFSSLDKSEFTVTIPPQVPSGEYLVRMEQVGLQQPGLPEYYVSCAQIKITDGGSGTPAKVEIPGYIAQNDPSIMINIFDTKPTSYKVPGPDVYYGF